jgi:hypothetical protein
MLGNASSWQIICTVTTDGGAANQTITLDALGLAAIDVVTESGGAPSQLELRIVDFLATGKPSGTGIAVVDAPAADGTPGFAELLGLAQRLQTALGKAVPLGPRELQGANASPVVGFDVNELDGRATALATSFAAAVQSLTDAAQTLQNAGGDAGTVLAAVQGLRKALIGLADHGVPASWPAAPPDSTAATVATLNAQAVSILAAVQPLAAAARPTGPGAGAKPADVTNWLAAVTQYVQGIVSMNIPLVPTYLLPPDSDYAAALAPGVAPVGADAPAVMAWLRRIARVRANSAAMHDALLSMETLQGAPITLTTTQLPPAAGAQWVGLPFTGIAAPTARLAHVLSTPVPIDPAAAFCGFSCDTWTEQVPGLTTVASGTRGYEPAEVTGMAFRVDAPDAFAPQGVLLAIAPDQSQGWSLDVLLDTVRETLELAKIRTVDLGDLPRLGRVLPAIHSGFNVDQMIQGAGENL